MEAVSSKSAEDINTFLTACADAGVLEVVEGRWRFAHDKLRETLLHDLSETERRDLHRKVATAIETVYPNDESYYEILLEYWRVVDDSARELQYLVPVVRYLVDTRGDFDRAVLLADYGLTLGVETDRHRPPLLNLLGKISWQLNRYPSALQSAQQAQQVAEQIGDQQSKADSLRIRGQVLTDQGEYPLANDYFQQSLAIYRQLGDQVGIADNLLTLGIVADKQGDYPLADNYYQQSLVIYRELGDQVGIANNLGNLGNVAESQGDFTGAKRYAEQGMAIFRAIGNRRSAAICLSNLGNLAYREGDYVTASNYLQQGLVIGRETGHRRLSTFSLNILGLIRLAQNNLSSSTVTLFYEALSMAEASDALPVILEALVGLAHLNLRIGAEVFAAELAGMIEQHPALDEEIRTGELARLKHDLAAALDADELTGALERGKILDVRTMVKKLLAQNVS